MELRLHNTRSGRKETFRPADPDRVTMYVCGPTVYGRVHIGNGRPAVVFDVLYRLLRVLYRDVAYVRNVTDIDDKINAAAQAGGEPISALAERFTRAYREDVLALGTLEPTVEPRATGHIAEIIAMIERLVERGHAYEADGHVLFHVPSDPDYGSLSHRSLEDMIDGARVEVAPYKRDPKDFVLWKPSGPELPGWDSPWGRGRPGWHIECSAMIKRHLGETIDIHGGGSDLTFPHHENEASQSRCANDADEYVRYWLHNGMLTLGQEKMSKSLGNIVTIHELLERHSGEVLRYALLSGQYRQQLAFSEDLLTQAASSLDRLYEALRGAGQTSADFTDLEASDYPADVLEALCDDLNTPRALAAMHALADAVHQTTDAAERTAIQRRLLAGGWLLGLLGDTVDAHFQRGSSLDADRIEALIEARNDARRNKDFRRADEIRDELAAAGIELEDSREGTRWKVRGT
ncbi:MAG: cysteine--tRNA ligase [Gammaproteobacteria bacterium]|nr:cysteine--tRNA ligase [Gammaproteobacteria bacterium]MBK80785.1 cysteine--tRNA ligase [Gammaproteobacteria bacterium]|tara:strand:+ start:3342 stop:4730 length:1389 start_codon:yes stop_codon:yes gene_type:complete